MSGAVIVSGARTPIGKLGSSLSCLPAVELGAWAIAEALRRASIMPDQVDYVAIGQVLQAGQGQNPARQAAVLAGVPMAVQAVTVNKVCLSGLESVHLANLLIDSGEAEIVVAGGMESMSGAPYYVDGARPGLIFGDRAMRDVVLSDGLTDAFSGASMGAATDRDAVDASIGRDEQDAVALRSHQRAATATRDGRFAEEIISVAAPQRRGDDLVVRDDEGIRGDTSKAGLAALKPAFGPAGTITPGNASQLSDGAAALVVMSCRAAHRLGMQPLAEIVSFGRAAGPGSSLLTQPSRAIADALGRSRLRMADLDAIEINEAFAAVVVASARRSERPGRRPQPERRCYRPRSPHRHVRHPAALHFGAGVEAPGRWYGRRCAMRWWRAR